MKTQSNYTNHSNEAVMKKILITGANSYIGTSFENYINENFADRYSVDTVDMIDGSWRGKDFSGYDTVFHVAGIAHSDNGKLSDKQKKLYYAVNTDLTIEVAEKAKAEGIGQFIFMSSAIVYGDSAPIGKSKVITKDTPVSPNNDYGGSKVMAENGILPLSDNSFKVVVLRPPMIYGKGSKGNYPTLSKFAQKLPFFPNVQNERSMLYIGNLVEFVRLMIENEESGIFFPQNAQYTSTSEMVKTIARAHGKNIHLVKGFTWTLKIMSHLTGLVNKAFGNLSYDMSLSEYKENYRLFSLKNSMRATEGVPLKKKVLILVNHNVVIYNFRKELVQRLVAEGYEVYLSCPQGNRIAELKEMGCHFIETDVERRSKNPFKDLRLLSLYKKMMKQVCPDIVLSYTIKPNIYGGIAARKLHIPQLANITGLGTSIEDGGLSSKLVLGLYQYGLKSAKTVFFQNRSNKAFCENSKMVKGNACLLPGSGVNLEEFSFEPYPKNTDNIVILVIGRMMKNKGTGEILQAAEQIRQKHENVIFRFIGFPDDDWKTIIDDAAAKGIIEYCGNQTDVHSYIKNSHATLMASYHEGMSNVLLETAATGRPVIATDIPGCRETFDDGKSGIGFEPQSVDALIHAVEKFLSLSDAQRAEMGRAGRVRMEKLFDRQFVVNKYIEEIEKAVN